MKRPTDMSPEKAEHVARLARAMHEASGAEVVRLGELEFRWPRPPAPTVTPVPAPGSTGAPESEDRLSPMERRRRRNGAHAG